MRPLGPERPRRICTDAVLLGLERNIDGFSSVRKLSLDWTALGSATTADLVEISRRRPDLLREVPSRS